MPEFFNCERHPQVVIEVRSTEGCADCLTLIDSPIDGMTGDEKAREVEGWLNLKMSAPFADVHRRIEALVGREVWTHEMGLAPDRLIEEARGTRAHPISVDEVINDLRNTGKPVIEVGPGAALHGLEDK